MRERKIYLQLLADLEKMKDDVDRISTRIHEMIDEWDAQVAQRIADEHAQWMSDGDNDND
jgi:hypothetical protein